jgi:hypothetical protein
MHIYRHTHTHTHMYRHTHTYTHRLTIAFSRHTQFLLPLLAKHEESKHPGAARVLSALLAVMEQLHAIVISFAFEDVCMQTDRYIDAQQQALLSL